MLTKEQLTIWDQFGSLLAHKSTRRTFLVVGLASFVGLDAIRYFLPKILAEEAAKKDSYRNITLEPATTHYDFSSQIQGQIKQNHLESFISDFKESMSKTARECIVDNDTWIIPSPAYEEFYARDSYWVLAALRNKQLLEMTQAKFHADQKNNPDGRISTALSKDGLKCETIQGNDESTLLDIIREYELYRLGGNPDRNSLISSFNYILQHTEKARFVTLGPSYHYWADTYLPDGLKVPSPQVFAYNQGLFCVALKCLEEMNIVKDTGVLLKAEAAYANMVNPKDGISLPQREKSDVIDVSSLAGEALSLYYFNKPLLSDLRVQATFDRFSKVYYPDGKFLGFKVISSFDGSFRPVKEFSIFDFNHSGDYQNGASWLLYDALALYAAGKHQIPDASKLLLQRLESEFRSSYKSHEYLKTSQENIGETEKFRDNYGWNSFVTKLLP